MSSGSMQGETVFNRRIILTVILAALLIGILLQLMLMRVETVGVDWIAVILELIAVGILVMAGLMFHHELCHVQK
jgi:sterol desaturase/sphingolipid hydroxylase (fatty acid hydroxylase superfamily)